MNAFDIPDASGPRRRRRRRARARPVPTTRQSAYSTSTIASSRANAPRPASSSGTERCDAATPAVPTTAPASTATSHEIHVSAIAPPASSYGTRHVAAQQVDAAREARRRRGRVQPESTRRRARIRLRFVRSRASPAGRSLRTTSQPVPRAAAIGRPADGAPPGSPRRRHARSRSPGRAIGAQPLDQIGMAAQLVERRVRAPIRDRLVGRSRRATPRARPESVDSRLTGQPEHFLAEDVALHLARPAADRERTRVQVSVVPARAVGFAVRAAVASKPYVPASSSPQPSRAGRARRPAPCAPTLRARARARARAPKRCAAG